MYMYNIKKFLGEICDELLRWMNTEANKTFSKEGDNKQNLITNLTFIFPCQFLITVFQFHTTVHFSTPGISFEDSFGVLKSLLFGQ